MVATQEQTHRARGREEAGPGVGRGRGGGGGGVRHCTLVHIPVYMNRVLPKWYKEVSSYLIT